MVDHIHDLEAKLQNVTETRVKIDLLTALAWELRDSDQDRLRRLSEQAHQLATTGEFSQEPYQPGIAASLRNLAFLNMINGNYKLAVSQSFQALAAVDSVSQPTLKIQLFNNIGATYTHLGNFAEALDYHLHALKIARNIGARTLEVSVLGSIGLTYTSANNPTQALENYQKAIQLSRELGDQRNEAILLNNVTLAHLKLQDHAQALASILRSLELARELAMFPLEVAVLGTVGEVYLAMNDHQHAVAYLQQSLISSRRFGLRYAEFWDLISLGKIAHHQYEDESALVYFQHARDVAQDMGSRSEEAECHQLLASIYERREHFKDALDHYKRYLAIKESLFGEEAETRLAVLEVTHEVETAKKDAEIFRLKNVTLQQEIEERKRMQVILEELAITDYLTKLYNRRQFFLLAETEFERTLRYHHPLSVAMFDIDHFKQVNDTYGHTTGDVILFQIARFIQKNIRESDVIGRYGGEEFILLLPETDSLQAKIATERIREGIAAQPFETEKGAIAITISIGIVGIDADACAESSTLDMLIDKADQALYAAKESGRNRTLLFQDMVRGEERCSVPSKNA